MGTYWSVFLRKSNSNFPKQKDNVLAQTTEESQRWGFRHVQVLQQGCRELVPLPLSFPLPASFLGRCSLCGGEMGSRSSRYMSCWIWNPNRMKKSLFFNRCSRSVQTNFQRSVLGYCPSISLWGQDTNNLFISLGSHDPPLKLGKLELFLHKS